MKLTLLELAFGGDIRVGGATNEEPEPAELDVAVSDRPPEPPSSGVSRATVAAVAVAAAALGAVGALLANRYLRDRNGG